MSVSLVRWTTRKNSPRSAMGDLVLRLVDGIAATPPSLRIWPVVARRSTESRYFG